MSVVLAPGSVTPPAGSAAPPRPTSAPPAGTPLPSHYEQCVGCGREHPMGLAMQMVAGDGLTVTAEVTLTDHHQGAPGLVHGGLVAVALDEVLGGLGWLLQTPMVTGRLQVEYLRPVPVGTDLHLESQVVAVEGRRIFCQATMREAGDGQRRDLARAFAVFVAVEVEHFRRHGRAVPAGARAWEVNP